MEQNYLRLFLIFILALLISFSATPMVSILARKVGAIDLPEDRKMHKRAIPRLGGVAIFYGFIVAVLCLCDINNQLRGILIGAVIIFIVGILDDIYDLNAFVKLIFQIAAAVVVVLSGVTISFVTNPFASVGSGVTSLAFLSVPITIIWIVAITNAVNLIDGLDGLAAGISSITCVTLFFLSLIMAEYTISMLAVALLGSCIGFLPFNLNPAKIFMGDSGSTFLGFMLACISILGLFKVYAVISFAVPFFILGLPLFDTLFAIVRRLAKGQSPMTPDRGHLHHRLIDMGFSQKQAVTILYTTSGLLSMSGVIMMFTHSFARTAILVVSVTVLIVAGNSFFNAAHKVAKGNDEN